MFETAVVRERVADRRLLSISVVVHTAIVAAVVAASVGSTRLPTEAPKQMMPIVFAAPLPALTAPVPPRPAAAAPPKGQPAPGKAQARVPVLQTAPAVIPSAIPTVAPAATDPNVTSEPSGPIGVPIGKDNSVGEDVSAPAADSTGPLQAGKAGVTSPVVIHRVEPAYPPTMLRARMNGWVVLQCIIDKTGHIRDVSVVHSSFSAFEQPAIDAVQRWVFSPGTLRGEPVDVIFELTVKFEVR